MTAGNRRRIPAAVLGGLGLIGAGAGIGAAVATGSTLWLLALAAGLGALLVGIHNWRWSIYGLLLFMPFSGLPIIAAYPHSEIPVLLKDILFVLPAYVGFALAFKGRSLGLGGAPLALMVGIVLLIAMQSLPTISNPLVPLVGAKVWLLYIPCLFLGYQLVQNRAELVRMLGLATLVGMFPLVLGIVEAALLDTGHGDLVYRWYGPAAQAVSQQFYNANFEGGTPLLRVSSTFSFVSQYYEFTGFMIVLTFAYWRLTRRRFGALLWTVSVAASLTSGTRAAFVLTPFLICVMVVLTGGTKQVAMATSMLAVGLIAVGGLIGLGLDTLLFSVGIGTQEFQAGFIAGIPAALGITVTGLGTGLATGGTRYVLGDAGVPYLPYDPNFSESWWVKVILELGIPGLLLFGALLGWLIVRAYRAHRAIRDPRLTAVSAALVAFVVWVVLYLTKGPVIDLDPVNVYFWLFAGVLLRLPTLSREPIPAKMAAAFPASTISRPPPNSRASRARQPQPR